MSILVPQPVTFEQIGGGSCSMVFHTRNGEIANVEVNKDPESGRLFVFNYTTGNTFEITNIPNADIQRDERTGNVYVVDSNNPRLNWTLLTLYLEIGPEGVAWYHKLAAEMLATDASCSRGEAVG